MNDQERWHLSQYASGDLVAHHVHTSQVAGLRDIRRKGLLNGVNVLTRASKCECRGRLT